ncbi:amino acid ABC transporter permease [Agrobacterium rhizogenes]|uniref:amino acid ABC transporter permease n=1 Tax=Rhizobium rhizogenes TaxID=359 RepID=UPI0015724321|nr:amino acid ABC transporter permease [Rhizobium rhizogenes]NTF91670.1 amino acid ABC transporter permease [Rhizobium rhizogenes]
MAEAFDTLKPTPARTSVERWLPDIVLTVGLGILGLYLLWHLVNWAFFAAVWVPNQSEACLKATGACWSVVSSRWRLIVFGLYPFDEQWRAALACIVIITAGALSCAPLFWTFRRLLVLWLGGFATFFILMHGGLFGLAAIEEQKWGGVALNLFVFATVVITSMPLAVVFALLRRSERPVISAIMGVLIDGMRSVPLLAVVFMFALVMPFGLPTWLVGDKLYMVIVGFSLWVACYQSEIIRSGMQAIPRGQEDAAKSLGLGYYRRMRHIVLPQAFHATLPATINQLVVTLKETTVVVILGFFDVLASSNAAFSTAEWGFAYVETYFFVGMIFFALIFSMSRYGSYLERRLRVER